MTSKSQNVDFPDTILNLDWSSLTRSGGVIHRARDANADAPIVLDESPSAVRGLGSLALRPDVAWSASERRLDGSAWDLGFERGQPRGAAHAGPLARVLDDRSLGDIRAAGVLDADDADWHRAAWLGVEAHLAVPSVQHPAASVPAVRSLSMLSLPGSDDLVAIGSGHDLPAAASQRMAPESAGGAPFADPEAEAELAAAAAAPWVPYAQTSEIVSFETAAQDTLASGTVAGTGTSATLAMNSAGTGYINFASDEDWYRVALEAGHTYTFAVYSYGEQPITDPRMVFLYQPRFSFLGITINLPVATVVAEDDGSGPLYGATATMPSAGKGNYYIAVSNGSETSDGNAIGQYMVTVSDTDKPYTPVFTLDEMADYLKYGYWAATGYPAHNFTASSDPGTPPPTTKTTITFNDGGLNTADLQRAADAMAYWKEIANISFERVKDGTADIVFKTPNNNDAVTAPTLQANGHTTETATITIGTQWSSGNPTGRAHTFVHELGHALGLGHAGPYNAGSPQYGVDNIAHNDEYQLSIMSYLFANDTDSGNVNLIAVMPQMADIVAITDIYGANTTTRLEDDIYGLDAPDPRFMYEYSDSGFNAHMMTIYDRGGTDTINFGRLEGRDIKIDLRPGAYSDVGEYKEIFAISTIGTIIENANGGSGNDTITGNDADNTLYGNGGNDTIVGVSGIDTIHGGDGNDSLVGGSGPVSGSTMARLTNINFAPDEEGGGNLGSDSGSGVNLLFGEDGNDILRGGAGDTYYVGGVGNDTIYGANGSGDRNVFYYTEANFGIDYIHNFMPGTPEDLSGIIVFTQLHKEDVLINRSEGETTITYGQNVVHVVGVNVPDENMLFSFF
jgi:serralysin